MSSNITAKSFLTAIAKFSISSWANFFIGLLSVFITTRIFSPEIYGMLNLFNTTTGLLVGFSCLGLDSAFIRYYNEPPKGWDKKQLFVRCLLISILFLSLISAISLVFFYKDISLMMFNKVNLYLVVLICINALSIMIINNYLSQYYRIGNMPTKFTIQQILFQFFTKIFVISSALINPSIEVVLTMNTLGVFFLTIVYFFIQRKEVIPDKICWRWDNYGEVIRFGFFNIPSSIILAINSFMIPFLITTYLGSYQLGIYASAGFFVAAFGVVQGGFRAYWAAFMYGHYKDEQNKIIIVHNYIVIVILLMLGGFIALQHVVYMFIGENFHGSRLFFSLVLLDPLLLLLEQTTSYGIAIAKKNEQFMVIIICTVFLNFLLTWIFITNIGLIGVAIGSSICAIFRCLLTTWRGQKYYRSVESYKKTLSGILLIVAMGISNVVFNENYIFELLVIILIFVLMFLLYKKDIKSIMMFFKFC